MLARRGISVLDLAQGFSAGSAAVLLPDDVRAALESLAVLEHTSVTTTSNHVHDGSAVIGFDPFWWLAQPEAQSEFEQEIP
ncbi:MAG: hypothetical protein ACRDRA_13600 [Pseudonocardiaceae bacterium]